MDSQHNTNTMATARYKFYFIFRSSNADCVIVGYKNNNNNTATTSEFKTVGPLCGVGGHRKRIPHEGYQAIKRDALDKEDDGGGGSTRNSKNNNKNADTYR